MDKVSINPQSTKLKICLWTAVGITVAIAVAFESGLWLPGAFIGQTQAKFVIEAIMTLLSFVLIPTALYLFRIKSVSTKLDGSKQAPSQLLRWGYIRLAMLCIPMIAEMTLYYLFAEDVRFFYLAVINALCLFMVYPTERRCFVEAGLDEANDDKGGKDSTTKPEAE